MSVKLKETLNGLLTKAYGLDENGVTSLYNEDGSDLKPEAYQSILDMDVERIAKLKPDEKKIRDEAYGRATREVMTNFEKQIREGHELQSDKQGLELIEDLIAKYKVAPPKGDLTEDQIKSNKFFLDFVEKMKKEQEEALNGKQSELEEFKSQVKGQQTFQTVKEKSLALLDAMSPVLPEDPTKAKAWMDIFIGELSKEKYDIRDGVVVVLDAEGKDAQDGHGNRLKFEDIVKGKAEKLFEFDASRKRDMPNNGGQPPAGPIKITSEADFVEQYEKETDSAKRAELSKAYFAWRNGG